MTLVQRMFEGCDQVRSGSRFVCAYRACRLQAVGGRPGKYECVSRGYLLLNGSPSPPHLSPPPAYEQMVHPQQPSRPPGSSLADSLASIRQKLEEIERRLPF
jgi:hypothetical protein